MSLSVSVLRKIVVSIVYLDQLVLNVLVLEVEQLDRVYKRPQLGRQLLLLESYLIKHLNGVCVVLVDAHLMLADEA